MGLHVWVLYNVKIHTCNTKKNAGERITYTDGQIHVSSLELCVEETHHHLYTKVVGIDYTCECDFEEKNIQKLGCGYISCFKGSEGMQPGELVEYMDGNSFYYGAYSKWGRESDDGVIETFRQMSDCDGYYIGERVSMLREELVSADPEELTEKQQEYRALLENVSEEFIHQTLIIHS